MRRKEERKNLKEIVNFIAEKENKSSGDKVRGDKVESSASSSDRELKRKEDEGPFQVCAGTFHQSWH